MFLKNIELFGFKSFADKSRLEFSSGITALLGPNGCGKSNIVDSIKWVLGEQSMKTLRAGKVEDVIFNGTETRKSLNIAEVTLTISNEAGYLPMDVSEIAIKRRVHRSGESEYFINSAPVRLKDIRELFFDTGIGKSAYSILEQGKIDQILSQRPEDRRYIFEEAAGISRYKQKSQEAERKLQRTEENLRQVQGIVKEVKHTYDTRRVQAQRAQRYKELTDRIFDIEVDLQLSRIRVMNERKDQRIEILQSSVDEYSELQQQIQSANERSERLLDEVTSLQNERIDIQNRLHRIDESRSNKKSQIDMLNERIADHAQTIDQMSSRDERIQQRLSRDVEEIEAKAAKKKELNEELAGILEDVTTFEQTIETARERIFRNTSESERTEHRIRHLDSQQLSLRRDLQQITEHMVAQFDQRLKQSGYSLPAKNEKETRIKNLIDRMSVMGSGSLDFIAEQLRIAPRLSQDAAKHIEVEQRAILELIEELEEVFDQYRSMIPSFIDDFLSPAGILTKKRTIDENIENNYSQIESDRQRIRELGEENASLNKKLANYQQTLENLKLTEVDIQGRLKNIEEVLTTLFRSVNEQELAAEETKNDLEAAGRRIEEARQRIAELQDDEQQISLEERQLTEKAVELKEQIEQKQQRISLDKQDLVLKQELLANVSTRIERAKAEIDSLDNEMRYIYSEFEENYTRSLSEFKERMYDAVDDEQSYRTSLKGLKSELAGLGYINHMATEEFAEVSERYEFLKKQLTDLETAQNDLKQITEQIKTKSEELFEATYQKIKRNFHVMFRRLFGGGRAELRLVDPNDLLSSGIDILAQPPGKKLEKITLLSGGERSMTAVALLFATYLVKPSPFCILDEIDAALDDANIGYFLDVLREFSERSQFIIITHNKKTVLGSSTLLGVTMQEPGVSKVIAYKIGEDPEKKTIYDNG